MFAWKRCSNYKIFDIIFDNLEIYLRNIFYIIIHYLDIKKLLVVLEIVQM